MYLEVLDWCRYSSFQRIFLATSDITIFFTQNLNLYLPSSLSTAAPPPPQNQGRAASYRLQTLRGHLLTVHVGSIAVARTPRKTGWRCCGPLLKTLALFITKIFDFSCPIIEFITKIAKIDTLFMTKIVKNNLLGST